MLEAGLKEDSMIDAEEYLEMTEGIREFQQRYHQKTVTSDLIEAYNLEEENRRMKEDCLLYAMNQGIATGIAKGKAEGISETKAGIVRNLSQFGMSDSDIIRIVGCTEEEVQQYLKQ